MKHNSCGERVNCASCRFVQATQHTSFGNSHTTYECRRTPPVVVFNSYGSAKFGGHPAVSEDHWCGEFQRQNTADFT